MGSIMPGDVKHSFPADANTEDYARQLDSQDPLAKYRDDFIVPTKASLKNKSLQTPGIDHDRIRLAKY